jgi:beta-lactamase regulating signal transducer with metallopeptidase domain
MNLLESLLLLVDCQAFALQVAVGGMGVSALALGAAHLLRRRAAPLRYGVLLTGVIALLAVPALVGLGRFCQDALALLTPPPQDEVVTIPAALLPEFLNRPGPDSPPAVADAPMPVAALAGAGLLVVWAFGMAVGVCRLLYALCKQGRAPVGAPWQAAFWTPELQEQLARKLGLRRFPDVHLSPVAPMPLVIGMWRPRILLPEAAPHLWTQAHWEAVLLHEAAHIARKDHWAVLAQRGAVILFWWCPPVHVLARRLNELREQICDDCALQGACDRISYAELLVESAEHFLNLQAQPVPLGLLASARGGLEARVNRVLAMEKPNMPKLTLPGKLLGAALLGAACLLTTTGTAFSGGTPPPKKIQIKILVDGKEIDLSDARLLELLEAPKKKTAAEDQLKEALRALAAAQEALREKAVGQAAGGAKLDQPAGVGVWKGVVFSPDGKVIKAATDAKGVAFSPDGKTISVDDGKEVIVIDAASGRIIAKAAHGAAEMYKMMMGGQSVAQGKADPRIEELVKQAEAIKPGSGAEVRKALQGVPKAGDALKDPKAHKHAPSPMGLHVWDAETGKKIIVLEIEDGKVLNLGAADLEKLLGKAIELRIDLGAAKDKAKAAEKLIELEWLLKKKQADAKEADAKALELRWQVKPDKKAPPAPDLEALSRQIERLQAELQELRKRLEAGKK